MYSSLTDGKEIPGVDMCVYCQINTGGEHEKNCPLFDRVVAKGDVFGKVNVHYEVLNDSSINFRKGK